MKKKLKLISIDKIQLDEKAARSFTDEGAMDELARNIGELGVVQPIVVSPAAGRYELVVGARRLRAAKQAGLKKIPAVVAPVAENRRGIVSLAENLHREPLSCFDQAEAIKRILNTQDMTQKELAALLSISQSAVANKLRTLALADDQRRFAVENGLGERHVREIIRLPEEKWDTALYDVAAQKMSAAAAAQYVDKLLGDEKPSPRRHAVIKDVRIFFNTITRAVEVMNRSGLGAIAIRRDTPAYIEYIIKIPAAADKTRLQ